MGYLTSNPNIHEDEIDETINVLEIPESHENRTLLYGYTTERDSFHVYLKGGLIHKAIYRSVKAAGVHDVLSHESKTTWEASELVPNKRVYPESTDADFYALLKLRDVYVSFTVYEEKYAALRSARFGGFHGAHDF